ncbi:hypothetical protein RHGRI_026047 [Rhododendron griersonianum]|uniref:Uncharacterized protein n=1 Tax=Rhododendron griersonianum TaxID=479676 RepID=A0AAV6IR92_9ERIC|nr:hypothetical protein RHGRI_026047 [Rhododendron griersonianum]
MGGKPPIDKYYERAKSKKSTLSLGSQILDEDYLLGKSLKQKHIKQFASKGGQMYPINVVMTAADVLVEGFCMTWHPWVFEEQRPDKRQAPQVRLHLGRKLGDSVPGSMRLAVSPANLWTTEPASGRTQPRRGYGWDGDQPS